MPPRARTPSLDHLRQGYGGPPKLHAKAADEAARHLPLSPPVFQILLSLVEAPAHGYAIITDIRDRTGGDVRLTASTLYDALARLLEAGLIDELSAPPASARDDARRRYYRLSALGREVARGEAARLDRAVQAAREKRLLPALKSTGSRKP